MTLPARYFEAMYDKSEDPWRFESRWYEERKRALTLASLPRRKFRSGFEPGCSIGVFTDMLALRCDRLLASDVSVAAVAAAKERLRDQPHVTVEHMTMPDDWPDDQYDLVVLSEIGYYFSTASLDAMFGRLLATLSDDGVVAAVHWRHPVADYPLPGDEVHERLVSRPELDVFAHYVDADVRLDILTRPGQPSVAQAEGLSE